MESCLGEQSFQMWDLNRRLEAYLARVQALEEQNELLGAELGGLRAQAGAATWRARAEDELAALRALVDQRWREKHAAEVARDSLAEELEGVVGRWQQLRRARERTAAEAASRRRAAEAEKSAQGRLGARAAQLERELEAARAAHQEERAALRELVARAPSRPAPPSGPPAPAPDVDELARRLRDAWRGAARGYQERVAHLETSLGQARERLGRAVQGARESRRELQQLRAERAGLRERQEALAQRLEGRWQERLQAAEEFQLAVEALEQEKQGLQSQIAQVLESRQQLAHLKMSLCLEVATYRTLLEAENSRLQTPGGSFKASFHFQDPKPELDFPGTPEGQHLGHLLPVLSPTSFPSPLPNTLEIPVPTFLKSQEFLQDHTLALASTPIPPTPQASCPVTDAEARAQDTPHSLLQPQGGRQQASEPLWAEAKAVNPASILLGPEEPGGKQQEATPGQSPEGQVSVAQPLSPDHPSLEVKNGELGSSVSSIYQEEAEGQILGVAEKEIALEVTVMSSLQQESQQEERDLDMKEVQDSHGPLMKGTLKALGEETQQPLVSLENQNNETVEKEDQETLRSLEEESLETLKSLERENQQQLKSSEEEDMETERPLEQQALELPKSIGKDDSQILQSLEKDQGLMMSCEGNLETVLLPGKENEELVESLKRENLAESLILQKETQQPLRFQEAEDQEIWKSPAKEDKESLGSLEDESQETFKSLEKDNQESLKSLEEGEKNVQSLEKENQKSLGSSAEEDQKTVRLLEKENEEPLRSVEEEDQETWRTLEREIQQPWGALGEEEQMALRPLEKVNPEPLKSLGHDQELFKSLKEENAEAARSLGTENLKPLKSATENLEILETQEPLWSLEEVNGRAAKTLAKEIQEPLGSVEENQKELRPCEEETEEMLRPLGKWSLEKLQSEEAEEEGHRKVEEEKSLVKGEGQEPLASLGVEEQELPQSAEKQSWEDMTVGDQDPGPETSGRAGVESEHWAGLDLREWDGKDGKKEAAQPGELHHSATGEAWGLGSPESQEYWGPAEEASDKESTGALQDLEGQPEQAGAPDLEASQGMPGVTEPPWVPGSDQASLEVTLGSETAGGDSAIGTERGLEQEVVGLEDSGHQAREEETQPLVGEEALEGKRTQGLETSEKDSAETDALEAVLSKLPTLSRASPLLESDPEALGEGVAEEVVPAGASGYEGSNAPQPRLLGPEEAEETQAEVGHPRPRSTEPWSPTPILKEAPGPQFQSEESLEAAWELERKAEVTGNMEDETEFGAGEIPDGLQEEEEEGSREESEADELGETLPDSTPLGLYLRSPVSPRWDLVEEQRPCPQGEARKEDWDPALLTSKGQEGPPSEEEDGEEEQGQDSDSSGGFEDLGTEAAHLSRVPQELAEPLGQVPHLLEPAVWGQDGESDGFADEEESGEEGEEGREPEALRWESAPPVGSLQALGGSLKGNLLEPKTVGVSVPWHGGLQGAMSGTPMTAPDTESQDSAEPSSSEESDCVPLEREEQAPGLLETPSGMKDPGPGVGNTFSVNRGSSLEEESEHMNGRVVNGLEQSQEVGHRRHEAADADKGLPSQEEEGKAVKTLWAGASLHLGPSQLLQFTPREGEGEGEADSWSSGAD
ncbi:nestin [Ctenodactylus gundi]